MSIAAGQGKLTRAAKDFQAEWREVKNYWDDDVSRRFENDYVNVILGDARHAIEAIGQMGQNLIRMKNDCE